MVVTLLVITLVSASAVGFVYKITAEPIARAKAAKITAAIALVLPTFDNDPGAAKTVQTIDGKEVVVYTATQGQDTVGYAVETFTNTGFGGEIKLMVGFLKDGTINRVETLSHNETPGLGNKIEGKNPADFKLAVRKDGGDVDAITASTISSRAFSDAVSRAYEVYKSIQNSGNHE